jgi:hypothetical protein
MLNLPVKVKLTKRDFVNVTFVLLYRKISVLIVTVMGSLLLLGGIVVSLYLEKNPLSLMGGPLLMVGIFPLLTYIAAIKSYSSNGRSSEEMEYYFNESFLTIKGESFSSEFSWSKVYKVTKTKNWLLIWHNKQVANPIPMNNILYDQLYHLKTILHHNCVKNNL